MRVVMWKCVFNNVEMHIWLWEYAYLVMLGYGHDESAPTPGGVFCGVSWVGVTLLVIRSQCYWQSVRSCRGRFIVPVPTNTHKMALQFVIFRTSRQIEKERSKPMMFASLLCFMC